MERKGEEGVGRERKGRVRERKGGEGRGKERKGEEKRRRLSFCLFVSLSLNGRIFEDDDDDDSLWGGKTQDVPAFEALGML